MGRAKPTSDARRRILEAADRLFYAEGIRAVGIDRIIAESGVAKMTLYAHFRSKDDLILAALEHRDEQVMAWFARALERHAGGGGERLDAFFSALKEWIESPTFRGCAFLNALSELADPAHPGFVHARGHKHRFHAWLAELIEGSLGPAAARHAPAIAVLVEGAIVTAVIEGTSAPADVARDAALRLVMPGAA